MLRNVEKIREAKIDSDKLSKTVEQIAQIVDLMGSNEASVDLTYDGGEAQMGDLVPIISIGVRRVTAEQVTSIAKDEPVDEPVDYRLHANEYPS